MATAFAYFHSTPIISSSAAGSNQHKPKLTRRKTTTSSSSANWWTPLFGWPSDPDYIRPDKEPAEEISPAAKSETGRSRSRFGAGCFTEEKAKELRRKTAETATFHDIMYHSAIASRLASDTSDH